MMHQSFLRIVLCCLVFASTTYAVYWTANQKGVFASSSTSEHGSTQVPTAPGHTSQTRLSSHKTQHFTKETPQTSSENPDANFKPVVDSERQIVSLNRALQVQDPANVKIKLTNALQSSEAKVRYSALATSLEKQIELPAHALQQMTSFDIDRDVRGLALTAFTQHPAVDASLVRATVQMALRDNDPEIQAQATGILEYLDLAARPNE